MKKKLVFLYLFYLRFFAKLQLRKVNPIVIGVGGSSGKTSTANIIATILSQKYSVKQSKGKNSETGIPLNILGIEQEEYSFGSWFKILFLAPFKLVTNNKSYKIYVVEMGIDNPNPPKNMEYLLKIIKPDLSLLTNIDIEHSQYFDSLVSGEDQRERKRQILNLITREEGLLLKSSGPSDKTIVNLDDPNIKSLLPLRSKSVTVSAKDRSADLFISKTNISLERFEMEFVFLGENYSLVIPQLLPKYFMYSFGIAIAASFSAGVSIKDSVQVIESNFSLPAGRFSVLKGIKNSTIIDSSYNSSLTAAKGALETIDEIDTSRRKLGILGDMRELGSLSRLQHEDLAKIIIKTLDSVILIGEQMDSFVVPVLEQKNFQYKHFMNFTQAKSSILSDVKENDIVLIKASQNTLFLERVVDLILDNKEDKKLLCRRGVYWDKIRRNTP